MKRRITKEKEVNGWECEVTEILTPCVGRPSSSIEARSRVDFPYIRKTTLILCLETALDGSGPGVGPVLIVIMVVADGTNCGSGSRIVPRSV